MSEFSVDPSASVLQYRGGFLGVETVAYSGPDGQVHQRDVVHHPGAVVIVPYLAETGSILLIEQYRVATNMEMLELPAGKRDVEGEDPHDCAVRELEEELGLRATSMVHLGSFFNSPGFCDELTHVYLARGLSRGSWNPQGAEEALAKRRSVALMNLERLMAAGKIIDAKTIVGMYATRSYLDDLAIPENIVDDIEAEDFAVVESG